MISCRHKTSRRRCLQRPVSTSPITCRDACFLATIHSLNRSFWGYLAGSLIGAALGITMGLSTMVRTFFYPIIALTYPIPKIAILPLIMLIFGIGELSKIVVVAIGSFFLVLMNTISGLTISA